MLTNKELLDEIFEDLRRNRFEYDRADHIIFDRRDGKYYTIEQFIEYVNDIEYERLSLIGAFRKFMR